MRTFLSLCLSLYLAAIGPAIAESLETQNTRTDVTLREEMLIRRIPGMQAAIIARGHVVFRRNYGVADPQSGVPVTRDTKFPINSATKAFSGVACLQLVETGKLSLDTSVSAYLDGLPDSWGSVTIRQLLTHTSGLPDIIDPAGNTIENGNEAAAWKRVYTLPLQFRAGEHFSYNQTNFALLQRIVERLERAPFEELIQNQQFKPSRMRNTEFGDSHSLTAGTAVSYHYIYSGANGTSDLQKVDEAYPAFMYAGAGVNTSAEDLTRWLIAVQAGRFFKNPSTLSLMWTPGTFNNGKPSPRALGWTTVQRAHHRAVGAEGGGRAAFAVYPDDGVAVIVLTNLAGANPEEILDQLAMNYIPGMKLNGVAALRLALQRTDFADSRSTYEALKEDDAEFEASEGDLNRWGYRLLGAGKTSQALEVFKLIVSLHPGSANAFDSLASGYEAAGNKELAMVNYRRSLELDPANGNARDRIQALGGG